MRFSTRVLIGLTLGVATGIVAGERVAPLGLVAGAFVRLLQMTVLPYVTLSITSNLGSLTYAQARTLALRTGAVLVPIWLAALGFACLVPLAFPHIETAAFFSPSLITPAGEVNFLELYVPSNPFHALANSVVPAVVLFSVLVGLAIIGIERKAVLLEVLAVGAEAVGRVARFIVRLTPFGIFAIAANAAGTLRVEELHRIEVYVIAYVAFALLLALWVLPGLIAALTPIRAGEALGAARDALLTAFLVGDLFIVLPALMEASSQLLRDRLDADTATGALPSSIVPTSFTFPHAGKLLSLSFVLFAGWFSDSVVPLARYPQLLLGGFFSFFGSLNVALPFLLDLFRIPADTFQLFLATGVVNSRVGALLAAVHTLTVGVLGSAAIAGRLVIQPGRIVRFLAVTAALCLVIVVSLRAGFATFVDTQVDGRSVVNAMTPLETPPVDDRRVLAPSDVATDTIPDPDAMLSHIRARGRLRVGIIADGIPYAFRNDLGQLVGFDVEMAQRLASDLGVGVEFVRFRLSELAPHVNARVVDIVMTGARVTPERAAEFAMSEPYLDETLAIVTRDEYRGRFTSWAAIRERGAIQLGAQNLPYYMGTVHNLLPEAHLTIVPETTALIDANAPFDGYVLPAERGSVLTMLNPRFAVVVPEGATIRMPLAYPIAGRDPSWIRFVNAWIGLKKRDGFVERLYDHWILGRAATRRLPRWSVLRDVLHWVE